MNPAPCLRQHLLVPDAGHPAQSPQCPRPHSALPVLQARRQRPHGRGVPDNCDLSALGPSSDFTFVETKQKHCENGAHLFRACMTFEWLDPANNIYMEFHTKGGVCGMGLSWMLLL